MSDTMPDNEPVRRGDRYVARMMVQWGQDGCSSPDDDDLSVALRLVVAFGLAFHLDEAARAAAERNLELLPLLLLAALRRAVRSAVCAESAAGGVCRLDRGTGDPPRRPAENLVHDLTAAAAAPPRLSTDATAPWTTRWSLSPC